MTYEVKRVIRKSFASYVKSSVTSSPCKGDIILYTRLECSYKAKSTALTVVFKTTKVALGGGRLILIYLEFTKFMFYLNY